MKKIFFICLSLTSLINCFSQNVGIGTNTPSEKLDVNGNLNITGNLKVNGVSGQNGQILTTNAAGQTIWSFGSSDYKNVISFIQNGFWNVPAGVTNIMVEAWGGGGGGAAGGGGASGSYMRLVNYTVIPGNSLTITIGTGGNGALNSDTTGSNGGNTVVLFAQQGFTFTAYGGNGASVSRPGLAGSFAGGPFTNVIYINSNPGEATTEFYDQINTAQFARVTRFGSGANSTYMNFGSGGGGFLSYNMTNASYIKKYSSSHGSAAGAGGGGGEDLQAASGNAGSKGANGLVLIWY